MSGVEWLIEARDAQPHQLRDEQLLQRICESIIEEVGLHVVGRPLWHQFPAPGGVTGMYLLSESHLTCHTFPETGQATFNLYCCRPRPEWPWKERLQQELGAKVVELQTIHRCGLSSDVMLAGVVQQPETRPIAEGNSVGRAYA